jgi:CelD/BcsL family acetyltransferase involved in cellulose biosynthesis
MSVPVSHEAYLERLTRSKRREIRRYAKRLEESFGDRLEARCLREPKDVDAIFSEAESVAATTYQRGLGVGFDDTPERRGQIGLALGRGDFRAYLLYIDGEARAFCYGMKHGRTFYTTDRAHDPDFAAHRLGQYLQNQLIKDICDDPQIEWMDLGFGDAEYKRELCDRRAVESTILIFSGSLRAIGINLIRSAVGLAGETGRFLMERLKLAGRLKRAWRRSLATGAR